ncbi:MAG: hypothetical protein ABI231_05180, partial [Candidatus Tumulicola sp.]
PPKASSLFGHNAPALLPHRSSFRRIIRARSGHREFFRNLLAAGAVIAALAACSFQNKNEREADKITHAVMNNDLRPVQDDIAKGVTISRVKVAEWSDELSAQGKLLSIKETTADCQAGWHCFDAKFEKRAYVERMRLDENGKVVSWNFKMAIAPPKS